MSKPTREEMVGKLEQIVNDSYGVDGFHLNGDIASWDELEVPAILQAIREALEENQIMRELLWVNHGCPSSAMYGDDGKMDCNACVFDFKNGDMKVFAERRATKNMKRYQEYLKKGASR